MTDQDEYETDIMTGRRQEFALSDKCLIALQYFPEFDNISVSFYTENMPGFTMGLPTEKWPEFQKLVAGFNWSGRRH